MKKLTVIAVGRIKERFFADALDEYAKRLSRFADLRLVQIDDVSTPDSVKRESAAILEAVGTKPFWLMDIGGEIITSEQLSIYIEKECALIGGVTVVIGGSDGVDQRVRDKAARRLSFGKITYPHQLMRVILYEQLYRGCTISAGLPYHK